MPNLCSNKDEHLDEVSKVLAGNRSRARQIVIDAGTLNLFRGHYSMHRVTEVVGKRRRLQTIFSFANEPNALKSSVLHYGTRVAALESAKS